MSKHPAQRRWASIAGTLLLLAAGRSGANAQTVPVTPPSAPLCQGWTPLLVTGDQIAPPGAMAVRSADDIWNVSTTTSGDRRTTTLIRHWNGSAWSTVPSPNPDPDRNMLNAVAAPAADDAWAVGSTGMAPAEQGLLLHWDGTAWRDVAAPPLAGLQFSGVAATARDDVWAVGSYYNGTESDPLALALHWDGQIWHKGTLPIVPLDLRALANSSTLRRSGETAFGSPAAMGRIKRCCYIGTAVLGAGCSYRRSRTSRFLPAWPRPAPAMCGWSVGPAV